MSPVDSRPNPSLNADVPPAGAARPAAGRRLASIRWAPSMCTDSPLASMSTSARNLPFLVAATMLAVGCASTPPSKVVVPIPVATQVDKTNIYFSDLRTPQQRQPRVDPEMTEVIFLGDETFEPAPVSMLNRAVSPKLKAAADPFVIELVRFDVAVSNSAVRDIYRSSPPLVVALGAPAGANVTGNLIGQLLYAAFQGGGSDQTVVVRIEIHTPSGPVEITDYGYLYSGRSITDAIQAVLPRALDSLGNRAAEANGLQPTPAKS